MTKLFLKIQFYIAILVLNSGPGSFRCLRCTTTTGLLLYRDKRIVLVIIIINVDSMLFRIFFIYLSDMAVALRCSYGLHSICIIVFLY